jgi:hypothetical protein
MIFIDIGLKDEFNWRRNRVEGLTLVRWGIVENIVKDRLIQYMYTLESI